MSVDDRPTCRNYIDIDGKDGLEKLEIIKIKGTLNPITYLQQCVKQNIISIQSYGDKFWQTRNNKIKDIMKAINKINTLKDIRQKASTEWITVEIDKLVPHLLGLHYFSTEHIGKYTEKLTNLIKEFTPNSGNYDQLHEVLNSIVGNNSSNNSSTELNLNKLPLFQVNFLKDTINKLENLHRDFSNYQIPTDYNLSFNSVSNEVIRNIDIDIELVKVYNKCYLLLISHCLIRYIWLCIIDMIYKEIYKEKTIQENISKLIKSKHAFLLSIMTDIQEQFTKALIYIPKLQLKLGLNYITDDINKYDLYGVKNTLIVTTDAEYFDKIAENKEKVERYTLVHDKGNVNIQVTPNNKIYSHDIYICFYSSGNIDYLYIPELYDPYQFLINNMILIDVPSTSFTKENNIFTSNDVFECSSGLENFFTTLCKNMNEYLKKMRYILYVTFISTTKDLFFNRLRCKDYKEIKDCYTLNSIFSEKWDNVLDDKLNEKFWLYLLSQMVSFFKEFVLVTKTKDEIIKNNSINIKENIKSNVIGVLQLSANMTKLCIKLNEIAFFFNEIDNDIEDRQTKNPKNAIAHFYSKLEIEKTDLILNVENKKTYINLNENFLKSCIELSNHSQDIKTLRLKKTSNTELKHMHILLPDCPKPDNKVKLYEVNYTNDESTNFILTIEKYSIKIVDNKISTLICTPDTDPHKINIGTNYYINRDDILKSHFKNICNYLHLQPSGSGNIFKDYELTRMIGIIRIFFANDIIVNSLLNKISEGPKKGITNLKIDDLKIENYCDGRYKTKTDIVFKTELDLLTKPYTHYIIYNKSSSIQNKPNLFNERLTAFNIHTNVD